MKSLRWFTAAAVVLFATAASATNGMRMIGFGPVQNSMGGVSAAASLDAATIVTNPAGMSALDRRADVSGTYFKPTVSYDAQSTPAMPIASGNTIDSDRGASSIPTLGFVWRSSEDLTFGVAALGVAGMGVDYKQDLYGGKTVTDYMNARLAPAVSYRVMKGLSVGVALNLMYATMKYDVASGFGQVPHDTQGSFGYGATVGLQYSPVEAVTLGLAYESKSKFQSYEWDIASHQVPDPSNPPPAMLTVPGGKDTLEFDQPQVATLGAAFRPIDGLLVAADVEWINWSATNGKDQPKFSSNSQLTGAMPWNMNWSDQWVVKVGGEYAATKALKLRAGYNYGKMPLDKNRAFENVAFPAIAEHHVTVGAGYAFGDLSVNVAGMYVPEAKITGGNASGQYIQSYTTKMSQLAFDLGVAYRF